MYSLVPSLYTCIDVYAHFKRGYPFKRVNITNQNLKEVTKYL